MLVGLFHISENYIERIQKFNYKNKSNYQQSTIWSVYDVTINKTIK